MMQMMQQSGAGGTGPGGKPATASLKIEPHHWHQLMHDVSAQKSVLMAIAEKLGIEVPASQVLNMQPPVPGGAPGAAPGAPGAPGAAPAPGGAPPSQVAQQLPTLPPVAAKAAADGNATVKRLTGGTPVSRTDNNPSAAGQMAVGKIMQNLRRG